MIFAAFARCGWRPLLLSPFPQLAGRRCGCGATALPNRPSRIAVVAQRRAHSGGFAIGHAADGFHRKCKFYKK